MSCNFACIVAPVTRVAFARFSLPALSADQTGRSIAAPKIKAQESSAVRLQRSTPNAIVGSIAGKKTGTRRGRTMALTESYVAGPATPAVREITLGQLLEQAARSAPDRIALIKGAPIRRCAASGPTPNSTARRAHRARFAQPLRARRTHRGMAKNCPNGSCWNSARRWPAWCSSR